MRCRRGSQTRRARARRAAARCRHARPQGNRRQSQGKHDVPVGEPGRARPTDRHENDAKGGGRLVLEPVAGRTVQLLDGGGPEIRPSRLHRGRRLDERYEWPIRYEDLVPYYEAAERLLEITAGSDVDPGRAAQPSAARAASCLATWRDVIATANAAGHHAGVLPMAKGRPWMVAFRGTEFNSYHCVVAPLRSERGFELRKGARVDAAELVGDGRPRRFRRVRRRRRRVLSPPFRPGRGRRRRRDRLDGAACCVRRQPRFPDRAGQHERRDRSIPPRSPARVVDRPARRSASGFVAPRLRGRGTRTAARNRCWRRRSRSVWRGRQTASRRSTAEARRRFGVQVFGTMIPHPRSA